MANSDSSRAQFWTQCADRRPKHVGFWLGSAISYFAPSWCANVWDIKYSYVLEPVRKSLDESHEGDDTTAEALRLINQMTEDNTPLKRALNSLPFEQFMNCLNEASREAALDVIARACHSATIRPAMSGPNSTHREFIDAARCLLDANRCEQVTIFTTNYDTFLEEALVQSGLQKPPMDERTFPTYEVQLPNGVLRIVKVHGCLSRPETLVYASRHWTSLLLTGKMARHLLELSPDALLFAGYSFSDPHLRPVFAQWLKKKPLLLVLCKPASQPDDLQIGADYLRAEFLARHIDEHVEYCDLGKPEAHPLFPDQESHSASPSEQEDARSPLEPANASSIRGSLCKAQIVAFLASIVECCARGDADALLACYLSENQCPTSKLPEFVANYLLQLGHKNEYGKATGECIRIRNQYPDDDAVTLVTAGYESFARTIQNVTIDSAIAAYQILDCGRSIRSRLPNPLPGGYAFAAPFFDHRDIHFCVKALLFQKWTADPTLLQSAACHPFLKSIFVQDEEKRFVELEQRLRRASTFERKRQNLYGYAQLEDLRAQVLIGAAHSTSDVTQHKRDADRALRVARRVRDIYFSVGQLNSVILADRTFAWACLANGRTDEAVRSLAWALMRSFHCSDVSLCWKLGANLVRLFPCLGATNKPPSIRKVQLQEEQLKEVQGACRQLVADGLDASMQSKQLILQHVRGLYGDDNSYEPLKQALTQYANISNYPIFFPPHPSRHDHDGQDTK